MDFNQIIVLSTLIFLGSSFINVVLNTLKSIVTIKGTTFTAAIMNAITFGFYTFIIKQISNVDLAISIPITVIANFAGVYCAIWIFNLFKKDKLWRISGTITKKHYIDTAIFKEYFDKYNIAFTIIPLNDFKNGYLIDIFSKTQGESCLIKEIIVKYKVKYTIIEIEKEL